MENHHFNAALECHLDDPTFSEELKNVFRDFETLAYINGFKLTGIKTINAVTGESHGDLTYLLFDRSDTESSDLINFIRARDSFCRRLIQKFYDVELFEQVYLAGHVIMILESK